ncbi:uncharacterized protein LOC144153377 [Haemaphysalis longicornis]
MPLYPSFHWTIRHANTADTSLRWRCPGRRPTVVYRNGNVLGLNKTRLAQYYGDSSAQRLNCSYREVKRNATSRVPDLSHAFGTPRPFASGQPLAEEYVAVTCEAGIETLFTDYFLFARKKAKKTSKATSRGFREKGQMNVVLLGIDMTSRINFGRHMKLTRQFLMQELNAFEFLGYNKVGDNSFGNQIPLLTGLPSEYAERLFHYKPFDTLPHLWSVFGARGYVTLFLEEMPRLGLFVYPDLRGFRKPPTDYYPQPIIDAMSAEGGLDNYCAGSRLKTQVFLEYLDDVLRLNAEDGQRLFAYVWLSDVPHANDHALLMLDEPVHALLRAMHERRAFEDTAVVLLSDHGPRFGNSRTTEIGRHEDKTPFGFMVLPPAFLRQHPEAAVHLEVNQRRLVTAYDAHATLLVLSGYTDGYSDLFRPTQRGVSLFGPVPPERACDDAFIPPEFCACQGAQTNLDGRSAAARSFARFVVHYLNALNQLHFPNQCKRWKFLHVGDASVLGGPVSGKVLMRALVTTEPLARFEAYGQLRDGWHHRVDFVQRLDWYSDQTRCLPPSRWQKFCRCKTISQ